MTDKKLTDNEIIKALDILAKFDFFGGQRAGRELWNEKPTDVQDKDIENYSKDVAFLKDLINRQKAENKSQSIMIKMLKGSIEDYKNSYINQKAEVERLKTNLNVELENFATEYDNKIKAEAYKEFAERLKTEYAKGMSWLKKKESYYVNVSDIDNLLKELMGENND